MRIRIGYQLTFELAQATPMIVVLNVHYSRTSDLLTPDTMTSTPSTPFTSYRDSFGNWCNRITAPAGTFQIRADTTVNDDGLPDPVVPTARQNAVEDLPEDALLFLLPSRYADSDRLADLAWELFGASEPGWHRVQAINQWVHDHITFGYQWARPSKTAWDAYQEGRGVCRDYAHLGIAFCRALNIPARYCTGYVAGAELATPDEPMDFSGWFEVYLDHQWLTVDPRNLHPMTGRILIARGRDAADVAITTSFGPNTLTDFRVWAHEQHGTRPPPARTRSPSRTATTARRHRPQDLGPWGIAGHQDERCHFGEHSLAPPRGPASGPMGSRRARCATHTRPCAR